MTHSPPPQIHVSRLESPPEKAVHSRGKWFAFTAALFLVLLLLAGPIAYRAYVTTETRNWHVVREGVLYRSGQMSPAAFERVCREYGIRTVVNLREDKASRKIDENHEPRFCDNSKIAFHRFPQCEWTRTGKHEFCGDTLERFHSILRDPNTQYPILIHCFAGIHRTGAHVAMYRMEKEKWSPDEAIREMQSMGTIRTNWDEDLLSYLKNYRPRTSDAPINGGQVAGGK